MKTISEPDSEKAMESKMFAMKSTSKSRFWEKSKTRNRRRKTKTSKKTSLNLKKMGWIWKTTSMVRIRTKRRNPKMKKRIMRKMNKQTMSLAMSMKKT